MGESNRFLVRQWLDGSVIFDRQFGDTHALDPAAAAVFSCSECGERDRTILIEKISSFYPEANALEMATKVEGLLEHLDRLGLVRADLN